MDFDKIKRIPDRWLIFSILILGVYLIIRLANFSAIIRYFPLDNVAIDFASHMSSLHFLKAYGFHNFVPNWYNGFVLFQFYHPGWAFFTLPLLYFFKDVKIATFLSVVLIYTLGFAFFYFFGKKIGLSKIKSVTYFLLFFANPLSLSYLFRTGRLPELLAWIWFVLVFILVMYYRNKKLDLKFVVLLTIIYSLLFLSHILFFIVASLVIFSLFIIKNNKERAILIIPIILTATITSFFWFDFITEVGDQRISSFVPLQRYASRNPIDLNDVILGFVVPILFWVTSWLYFKNKKINGEFRFFLPIIIMSILYFTRLLLFIPIFNRATPDMYNLLFIFISIYMIMNLDLNSFSARLKRIIFILSFIIPILFVVISIVNIENFSPYSIGVKNTLELFNYIDGKFVLYNGPISEGPLVAYAAIYLNASTPQGWSPEYLTQSYLDKLNLNRNSLRNKDCTLFYNSLKNLKGKEVIVYFDDCGFLKSCSEFKLKKQIQNACLFSTIN